MQINGVGFEDLNAIQRRVILEMDKRDRLAVLGGPGTGKTFIAIFAILKALQENKDCFFIVYNKNLNLYIKKLIGKNEFPEYLAKTYHSWIILYLAKVLSIEPRLVREKYTYKDGEFRYYWDAILIELNKLSPDKRKIYDFVFLDEAQDIPLELLTIIKESTKKLMVTFDDSQKIGKDYFESQKNHTYDRSSILTTLDLADSFFDLTQNYRNTDAIEKVAKLFGQYFKPNEFSLKQQTSSLKGPLPNLIRVKDLSHSIRFIYADYKKNPHDQIGILFANTRQEGDIARYQAFKDEMRTWITLPEDQFFYKLGEDNTIKGLQEPGMYLMSMHSAKGLEFDRVYLIGTEKLDLELDEQANLIYVACTRAKKHLTFLYEGETYKGLLKQAFEHPLLFNQFDASPHQNREDDHQLLTMIDHLDYGG
jgi:superfamily I DNA/RNA helicase